MAMSRGGGGGGVAAVGGGVSWNKPRALVCHICGREYGTTSLAIHLPQCTKMWQQRESLKPKNERRPVPAAPAGMNGPAPKGQKGIDAYNERAFTAFTDKSLLPCPHCGRKFLEDRLKVHLRSCRPGNEAKRVNGKTLPGELPPDEPISAPPPRTAGAAGAGRPSIGKGSAPPRAEAKYNGGGSGGAGAGDDVPIARGGGGGGGGVGGGGGFGGTIPAGAEDGPAMEMAECSICHRRFAADRLAKHESVCATHTAKDAKIKAKLAAKEAKKPKPKAGSGGEEKGTGWKKNHSELINSIRYARKTAAILKAGGDIRSLPPPPPSSNPDYVECPTCGRRYNEAAAARHIPKCKDIINKPKPPPRAAAPVPAKRTAPPTGGGMRGPPPAQARSSPATAGGGQGFGATYGAPQRTPGSGMGGMGAPTSLTTPPRTAGGNTRGAPPSMGRTPSRSPAGGAAATTSAGLPPIRPASGGGGRGGPAGFGSPPGAPVRFCENCGSQRANKANFCGGCGQRH